MPVYQDSFVIAAAHFVNRGLSFSFWPMAFSIMMAVE